MVTVTDPEPAAKSQAISQLWKLPELFICPSLHWQWMLAEPEQSSSSNLLPLGYTRQP